jgi:hypothetical protein
VYRVPLASEGGDEIEIEANPRSKREMLLPDAIATLSQLSELPLERLGLERGHGTARENGRFAATRQRYVRRERTRPKDDRSVGPALPGTAFVARQLCSGGPPSTGRRRAPYKHNDGRSGPAAALQPSPRLIHSVAKLHFTH